MIVSIDNKNYERTKQKIIKKFPKNEFVDIGIYKKHESNSRIGCAESHILTMTKFINSYYDYALICEDDVFFINNKVIDLNLEIINKIIKIDPDFQIIYLGHRLAVKHNCSFEKINSQFIKVKTNDTHCMIITKSFAKYIVNKYCKTGYTRDIDVYIRDLENTKYYALRHQIAYQKGWNCIPEMLGQIFVYINGFDYNTRMNQLNKIKYIIIIIVITLLIKQNIVKN